ncbi:folate-binding protein [Rhodobacterales bacterium HKCCE2091]|nr:folate-binding protein [Rhodobacterales bacterium HKCCE2091]
MAEKEAATMTIGETVPVRAILRITGADRRKFLNGLVTKDPAPGGLAWSALLTPQGKYLADFFLLDRDEETLLDCAAALAPALLQRLSMYRLRAAVGIEPADIPVTRGLGPVPDGAFPDPRHPALGWRAYGRDGGGPEVDWDAIRVAHCIPETGIELVPNESYILECGFERLNGVDHRKGCYVGQEVTARMKHKTELRKGLVTVEVAGEAAPGTEIAAGDRAAGTLHTRAGDRAIAYLRFDRAAAPMQAGDAVVTWDGNQPG